MRTINDVASFLDATGTKLRVWGSGDEWTAELSRQNPIGQGADVLAAETDSDLSHAITKVVTRYRLEDL